MFEINTCSWNQKGFISINNALLTELFKVVSIQEYHSVV